MQYQERAHLCVNPTSRRLLKLMADKQTNLAVAADIVDPSALIAFVEKIAGEICILKTHIDIVEDFSSDLIATLLDLQAKHHFLIFEDRKFADIGNTVQLQYSRGVYHIVDWADIVNAHILPGPGIIEGLRNIGLPKERGLLLLAQMSAADNLLSPDYAAQAVEWAKSYHDFVIGFIAMHRLVDDPRFITMTPGVHMVQGGDDLKQQYQSPGDVIAGGSDIIIVGRGIYGAPDVQLAAKEYRRAGWEAYLSRETLLSM